MTLIKYLANAPMLSSLKGETFLSPGPRARAWAHLNEDDVGDEEAPLGGLPFLLGQDPLPLELEADDLHFRFRILAPNFFPRFGNVRVRLGCCS